MTLPKPVPWTEDPRVRETIERAIEFRYPLDLVVLIDEYAKRERHVGDLWPFVALQSWLRVTVYFDHDAEDAKLALQVMRLGGWPADHTGFLLEMDFEIGVPERESVSSISDTQVLMAAHALRMIASRVPRESEYGAAIKALAGPVFDRLMASDTAAV